MADQNRRDDSQTDENARKAGSSDRDQSRNRNQGGMGEQDDVAEDRNLSGASTWLNLPDQPKNDSDDESNDNDDRTSRR